MAAPGAQAPLAALYQAIDGRVRLDARVAVCCQDVQVCKMCVNIACLVGWQQSVEHAGAEW
jgi:hypothetical protein